jgi:catechol 2,3-dioxygenase-like lactoylglutathione lyase family enzyme
MPITAMNHFTVLTDDLERTKAFYVEHLGLIEGERPPLGIPGAWLYAGGAAVLHVIAGRAMPVERRGVLDHMAFTARDLLAISERLRQAKIPFDLRRQPVSGTWQLFVFDPNGARVELDFDANEVAPA